MVVLTFILAVLTAFIPGIVWLFLFLKADRHPEPRSLLIYTFGIGMVMSIPIVAVEMGSEWFTSHLTSDVFISIFSLAFIEEVFKWVAAYIAVKRNPAFDEPVDYMVYLVTAALGLATVENFFVLSYTLGMGGIGALGNVLDVSVLRFVGATFLHALSSGIVGYYWAKGKLAKGFVIGTTAHGLFNYLVLVFQSQNLLLIPTLFLVGVSFVVFREFRKLALR